ncbi:HEAT repeat domain-containing protein [Nocardia sp. 2]|uniref:HEAT repeat domain-containing protein n=1 Tax=Nocardia acididurans TaxID=2802282 RepID=A0ABS1M3C2_9NOCA|nr:HEAT repeat domain-containing protein [Nocardia acididurans]MBL1074674.1 HEAT repeat domain-containing protein [Nocardia acididurans]
MNPEPTRAQTFSLLARAGAADTPDAARAEAFETLAALEDYRSTAPLTAMVLDTRLPEAVRTSASETVSGFDDTTTGDIRRTWWASGDPIVMRHALRLMTRAEADIVTFVAQDDAHPLQADALSGMVFGFDEPDFAPILVRALRHPDPGIARAAADALLWDEPVAAESALLEAAVNRETDVAAAAIETLRYYRSRRALRVLADLRSSDNARISALAANSFDDIREDFEAALQTNPPDMAVPLREWMRPVADLIESTPHRPPAGHPAPHPEPVAPTTLTSTRPLTELLDDPDAGGPRLLGLLRENPWSADEPTDRTRWSARLAEHPDPTIRAEACSILAGWAESAVLLNLMTDPSATVRKSAVWSLGQVPGDPAIADHAWAYLSTAAGTTASEAVRTYATHAPAGRAVDHLQELAWSDPRECVRYQAIRSLATLGADDALRTLAPMLQEPPRIHWGVHIALLDNLHELGIHTPAPDHLSQADNLDLMTALLRFTN